MFAFFELVGVVLVLHVEPMGVDAHVVPRGIVRPLQHLRQLLLVSRALLPRLLPLRLPVVINMGAGPSHRGCGRNFAPSYLVQRSCNCSRRLATLLGYTAAAAAASLPLGLAPATDALASIRSHGQPVP